MPSQAQKTQQTKMKRCARAWKAGDTQGRTYRTHIKACLKGGGAGRRAAPRRSMRARSGGGSAPKAAVKANLSACKQYTKERMADPTMMGRSNPSTIMQNCLRRAANPTVSVATAAEKPPALRKGACKKACEKDVAVKLADPYRTGGSSPAVMMQNCLRRCG